jgi:hypothetical protein
MNDSLLVRRSQSVRNLDRVVDRLSQRKAGHLVAQRHAFEELRNDVGRTIGDADVMHRKDVRMIERRRGACFLLEAGESFGI